MASRGNWLAPKVASVFILTRHGPKLARMHWRGPIGRTKGNMGVFEYDPRGITLTVAFGFDTIAARWPFFPTLNPSLATCCLRSALVNSKDPKSTTY